MFSIFYDHLGYFTAVSYNLWPFGIVCDPLVFFPILVRLDLGRKIWQPWSPHLSPTKRRVFVSSRPTRSLAVTVWTKKNSPEFSPETFWPSFHRQGASRQEPNAGTNFRPFIRLCTYIGYRSNTLARNIERSRTFFIEIIVTVISICPFLSWSRNFKKVRKNCHPPTTYVME
jgi:hypothetical protein